MSDGTTSVRRSRLRTWIVLACSFVGLLLVGVLVVWLWLRSDGDIRAVEAEVLAAGFDIKPEPITFTDPLRIAQARSADAAVQAIKIEWKGQCHSLKSTKPVPDEFRAVHQAISSQDVCAVAREIIALGHVPIRLPPGETRLLSHRWKDLFNSRLVIADGEELDLCLSATRVRFEIVCGDDSYGRGLYEIAELCRYLARRLVDRREQLHPMADWLDSVAQRCWDAQPQSAEQDLLRALTSFRHGEQALHELGISGPEWMQYPFAVQMAMRAERASVLRTKLSWLQFLNAHPGQPRVWLDEAARRSACQCGQLVGGLSPVVAVRAASRCPSAMDGGSPVRPSTRRRNTWFALAG